ncbi:MAG: sulfatase-like hydrolase/transferase [Candidatus Hydrogenedentota bacterium]
MSNKIDRRRFLQWSGITGLAALTARGVQAAEKGAQPNILWISTEDIGPHLGCYGDPHAITPTLDALAASGVRYTNAFTTAGVCAPNRSGIITGVYSTTLGTHHMRSGGEGVRVSHKPELPEEITCFPELLRRAGYYCTNNSKEDYQFPPPKTVWDESSAKAHWRNRPDKDQPFFAVFNFKGTHEGSVNRSGQRHEQLVRKLTSDQRQDPADMEPPPYHPDTPAVRKEWAEYYELITGLDYWVADILAQLEEDGLAQDTIVFFWADHGQGMPRCKRWIYDSGTHMPLIVHAPERWRPADMAEPGSTTERLVSSLDLGPTVLRLAGIARPDFMQGKAFLGEDTPTPRDYVFASRDRMDERYDTIRMVRDKRFKYIRNYRPFLPYDQYMNSAEKSVTKQELHRLAAEDALPPGCDWLVQDEKPVEELYDTGADPHEIHNLADDPDHADTLAHMRRVHEQWILETNDLGLIPEPELLDLAERFGSRYVIFDEMAKEDPAFQQRLHEAACAAGRRSKADVPHLHEALDSPHAAIRWWGATGLAYMDKLAEKDKKALVNALDDSAAVVRVAAAEGAVKHGLTEDHALDLLIAELKSDAEWVRLHAATALDHVGEKARPAIPALREALEDKENKYVVRVANHALNQLLGTDNTVR